MKPADAGFGAERSSVNRSRSQILSAVEFSNATLKARLQRITGSRSVCHPMVIGLFALLAITMIYAQETNLKSDERLFFIQAWPDASLARQTCLPRAR